MHPSLPNQALRAPRRGAWRMLPRLPAWRWPVWSGSGCRTRRCTRSAPTAAVQMPWAARRCPLPTSSTRQAGGGEHPGHQRRRRRSPTAPKGSPQEPRRGFLPDLPDDHPFNEFFKNLPKEWRGQPSPSPRPSLAQGSGFVISADGYVVTNNHVIDGASKIQVSFDKDNKYEAELIGTDPRTDIALLKIKASKTFPFVKFADKHAARRRLGASPSATPSVSAAR